MLLRSLVDISREINKSAVSLEVRQSNRAAINLYKSEGFSKVNIKKDYYPDHEDALIFTLIL